MTEPGNAEPEAVPLGVEDAQILALEPATIRGHTLKVMVLQGSPGPSVVARLAAHIESRLAGAPAWRQRLVPAPGTPAGLARPDDPGFGTIMGAGSRLLWAQPASATTAAPGSPPLHAPA